ncbi:autotransporter assembly complex protein TamA [Aquirhabdus sp.]|uniref:autotransporter assembly complex protein TamA n=1 Tax=Aquirhabdus sp. TaxID=2824160 RepID=UPI00396C3D9F
MPISRFSSFVWMVVGASLTSTAIQASELAQSPSIDSTQNTNNTNTQVNTDASNNSSTSSDETTTTKASAVPPPEAGTSSVVAPQSAPSTSNTDTPVVTPKAKPSFFKRVRNTIFFWRKPDTTEEYVAMPAEPTISVKVNGAPEELETNLIETLKQVTISDFEDFQFGLPRFRSLATDAAQAVGYYDANFRFSKKGTDTLVIDVVPGDPVKVASQKIEITGEAAKDKPFIRLQSSPDLQVGDIFNHGEYEKTKNRIINMATDRGYFLGHFLAHDVQVTLPTKTADIVLAYESGVRYKFGDVIYKNTNGSAKLPIKPEVLATLQPFKPGDHYSANALAKLSRNLLDTRYFNNVQVDAPTPDALVDDATSTPAVATVSSTAEIKQATDSNTTVSKDGAIPPKTNETESPTVNKDATPATQAKTALQGAIDSSILNDQNTGLATVKAVDIKDDHSPSTSNAKYSIPVIVLLNADHPNSAEVGLGFGTDTGPRIRTQYRRALINDSGHSFDANAEASKIRKALDVKYNIPLGSPLEDVFSVFGGFEDEKLNETSGLDVNTKTITVGAQRAVKPAGDWQRTYSIRYRLDQLENNALNVDPSTLPPPFNVAGISTNQQALLFGFGLNKVTSKGGINPTSGFRQFYQIDTGAKTAFSDANMVILRAGFRGLQSFAEKHQIVASADLGSIITTNFDDVPYNLRFFAGGDQSIRGFDYKSLSTQRNGYNIGGQNLAVGSFEYNYLFKPKWRGAVFVDAGNAFDKRFTDPVKVGAGFGVRWASPVGPVRVDIAAGVSERSVPVRLVFYIGAPL